MDRDAPHSERQNPMTNDLTRLKALVYRLSGRVDEQTGQFDEDAVQAAAEITALLVPRWTRGGDLLPHRLFQKRPNDLDVSFHAGNAIMVAVAAVQALFDRAHALHEKRALGREIGVRDRRGDQHGNDGHNVAERDPAVVDRSRHFLPQPQSAFPAALCSRTCAIVRSVSFADQ